ncbi:MAG: squalene/phytoene synthase family protein [Hyphomicrobiales bacterium]|nr:squalene/phytoene synthase family protein [Hyphomicrobiales bacterium]MBV8441268.1 squalene/phytoene synthase family protein [Hyphomicrobiales bacterium]
MTAGGAFGAGALAEAQKHCAAEAREHARDQWLGSLYAVPAARDALLALASFDYEIGQARFRARDPNLAAMRLAWWREVARGERNDEAAGSPVALALSAAIDAFALPRDWLEAMIDARLQEMAPQDDFNLLAFEAYAGESEGARLRLGSRIAAGGHDLDEKYAHAPAGLALALVRMLSALPFAAGSAPTLFPVDVAARHGASLQDFDARRASAGVVAACAEIRALAREKLAEAERRLAASPREILPAFIPLGALKPDLDRLERNGAQPFEPSREISALRRQWAIWRWARRR